MIRPLLTLDLLHFCTRHPKETLRTWAKRGRLTPVACEVRTRAHLYDANVIDIIGVRDTPNQAA